MEEEGKDIEGVDSQQKYKNYVDFVVLFFFKQNKVYKTAKLLK